jgi:hypothetical protein
MFKCSTSITCLSSSSTSLSFPIPTASGRGLDEIVKLLIEEHNADPNENWGIDCCQVTAVHNAIMNGHLNCVQILHENGADINKSGCINYGNMATVAAISGNTDLLKFLTGIGVGPVDNERFFSFMKMTGDLILTDPFMAAAIEENQVEIPE